MYNKPVRFRSLRLSSWQYTSKKLQAATGSGARVSSALHRYPACHHSDDTVPHAQYRCTADADSEMLGLQAQCSDHPLQHGFVIACTLARYCQGQHDKPTYMGQLSACVAQSKAKAVKCRHPSICVHAYQCDQCTHQAIATTPQAPGPTLSNGECMHIIAYLCVCDCRGNGNLTTG